MIFKSNHRHLKQITLKDNITDQSSFSLFCVHIYQFQTFGHSLVCLIIIAKKLITSTDGDHNSIIFYICLKISLDLFQFLTDQHLLSVRTTSKKYNIQPGKINLVIKLKGNGLCLNTSPLTPLHKTLDIASVTVKIQKIRV